MHRPPAPTRRHPHTPLATAPRHNATVEIFEPGESGFDHDRLLALVSDRISFVPRYRQRLAQVPGRLATPVWVDDEAFDLDYHLRRSALPRPGSDEQLRELVSRIVSRRLRRVDALSESGAQQREDLFRVAHAERGARIRFAHAKRRRPARTPAVTATTANARPTQVSPMLHHARVAET